MKKRRLLFQKSISLLTGFLLVFQSLTPGFFVSSQILAQDATATETPAPTPVTTPEPTATIEPTQTPEITPTDVIAPTEEVSPTIEPTPSIEPTVEVTPEPTVEATPTIEPTIEAPVNTPSNPPKETSPPANDATGEILDGVSTESPTPVPTITPIEPETGELQAIILNNVSAPTLDLDGVNPDGSAKLTTDKADYAPTDTAIITGSDFIPGKTYTLVISSSDNPPVHEEVSITTDDKGTFIYAYQLDGTYRPNYKVEVRDSSRTVAAITFTDSPVFTVCQNDAQGANDQPGQKDLTRMCSDTTALPTTLYTQWDWDEIKLSGSNTGDACNLIDTDNDGNANFSLCVSITGDPAHFGSQALFSCTDNRPDRCTGSTSISSFTSTCSTAIAANDPFNGTGQNKGDAYPDDTVATCTVQMIDFSSINARLIDVCSYPSQQPNSDPSDCIVTPTTNDTGTIEVIKHLSPILDPGKFNLQIDESTKISDAVNNSTTGEVSVSTGVHSVGETAGTSTDLTNYDSSISCVNSGGTVQGTSTNAGPLTISVEKNEDIVCTITNTRKSNASITIIKDAQPDNAQNFSFTTTGAGLSNFSLDDDSDATLSNTQTFSNLASGTYSIAESAVTGWEQTSALCDDGSLVNAISLASGEHLTCTFINTLQTGTLTIYKNVTNDNGGTASPEDFQLFVKNQAGANVTGSPFAGSSSGTSFTLNAGTYAVGETPMTGYQESFSSLCTGGSVTVSPGQTTTCTITNDDIAPSLTLNKILIKDNGGIAVESDWTLTAEGGTTGTLSGPGASGSIDVVSGSTFKAGIYTLSESTGPTGYSSSLWTCSNGITVDTNNQITLSLGQSTVCTITNNDIAPQLTLQKIVDNKNIGTALPSNWFLGITGVTSGQGPTLGPVTLMAGTDYIISESGGVTGYTPSTWTCDSGINPTNNPTNAVVNLPLGANVTCTITNTRDLANLKAQKIVDDGSALTQWSFQLDGGTAIQADAQGFVDFGQVGTGFHWITESGPSDYSLVSISGDCIENPNVPGQADVSLFKDTTKTCVFSNAINKGSLTIIKDATPDNDQDFNFTTTGTGLSNFVLDDDDDITLSNTKVFSGLFPDIYGVSENTTTGWDLTNAVCSDRSPINAINIAPGENVTCTFTNTQRSAITACKYTDTNTNGSYEPATDTALANIEMILTKQNNDVWNPIATQDTTTNGCTTFTNLTAGTYKVTENTLDSDLDGYYSTNSITSQTFTVTPGSTNTAIFLNALYRTISGTKFEDTNGNGTQDDGELGIANWNIYLDNNLNGSYDAGDTVVQTDANGDYEFTGLVGDTYQIGEIEQAGWIKTMPTFDVYNIDLHTATTSTGNDFGNFKLGFIQGRKYQDSNANGTRQTTETFLDTWTIRLYKAVEGVWTIVDEKITGHTGTLGQYRFENLEKGRYFICEQLKDNAWTQTDPSGTEGYANLSGVTDEAARCRRVIINTSGEENTGLFFGNIQYGTIHVTKYNDENGEGDRTQVMGGWTITATGQPNQITDEDGMVSFTSLTPNSYYINEDLTGHDGWIQTDITCESQNENPPLTQRDESNSILSIERIYAQEAPSNLVQLHEGEIVHCYIGNKLVPPEITISKTNNATGNKTPGESVLYTITVKVDKNTAHNVFMTDLLPKGFVYRPGSWTASITGGSFDAGHATIGQPTYASPGTWDLGDLTAGSEVTLTLVADIVNDEKPGTYKDLALAYGCEKETTCAIGGTDSVIATAVAPGYIDEEYHVGTEVTVVKDQQDGKTLTVERKETGTVLGASTELPSTGANANWIILAISFMVTGLGAIVISSKMRRYHA